ncbi:hypothetical protein AYI70_g5548, partial [Smittium culicis]
MPASYNNSQTPRRVSSSTPYSAASSQRAIAPRPRLSQNISWMNTRSQPGYGFEPLANRFPPSAPACYPAYNFQSPELNSAVNSQASVRSVHIQPNQAYGFMLPNALPLPASTAIIAPSAIAAPTVQPVQSTASASSSNSSRGYRIGGK